MTLLDDDAERTPLVLEPATWVTIAAVSIVIYLVLAAKAR